MYFQSPIIKFKILLLNELNSPELLPYGYQMVWFYQELINYQKILICIRLFYFKKENICSIIKQMELDRIEYLLKTYHRIRILKIETDLIKLNEKFIKYNRLNSDEKIYLTKYILLNKKFTKTAILNFIPVNVKNILRNNIILFNQKTISTKHFCVFFKILKKKKFLKENILNITSLFFKNEIYSIEYKNIKKLVYSGIIVLL
jgi:hypothetical protein